MNIRDNTYIMLSIIFILCFSLINHLSLGTDTISGNQSLSGNQTIVSSGGNFELGFFQPGNTSNFYIGIWYKKRVSVQTIVWVANRDAPISNKYSSELKILNGNLVLLNESQTTVWSTNIINSATSNNSLVATLGDDGNLVLKDGLSSTQQPIWQSFDYPTHTLLPGIKIGFNNLTNRNTSLTSWKNSEDPSTGPFSLELDPNDSQFILKRNTGSESWNRSFSYWRSGSSWRSDYIYNYSYVTNENESYFTYSLYNASIISRLIMDVSGHIKQLTWSDSTSEWTLLWSRPIQVSEIYGYCGESGIYNQNVQPSCSCLPGFVPNYLNDWDLGIYSGGCVRKISLQCGEDNAYIGKERGFSGKSHMAFPGATYIKSGLSPTECDSYCLSRCECTAYAYYPADVLCQYWNVTLINLQQLADNDPAGITLYFRPAESEFSSPNNDTNTTTATTTTTTTTNNNKAVVIGSVIGSVVGLVAVMGLVIFWRWKNIHGGRNKSFKTRFFLSKRHANLLNNDVAQGGSPDVPFFHLKSIITATDGFSVANKLGQGGFGPVYKGNLPNGEKIAVKRLSTNSGQGIREFKNEVILISKLQHRNLVKLLGFCVEGDEKLLIYEYMPNKSLDAFLCGSGERGILDWDQRYNIIEGIARGLLYLHRDSRLRVIHRDLKPGNILLDEEMNAKISDFGMAKMFGGNQTLANTNRIVGTYGYMSPEYAMQGLFSEKSDVFSFGVLLLEIVSSKKNTSFYHHENHLNLLGYAWQLWNEGKALELLDPRLANSKRPSQVMRCIHMGLLCVQEQAKDRPNMSTIVSMLCNEATLQTPKQPAYILYKSSAESDSSMPNDLTCSRNCVSITTLNGR